MKLDSEVATTARSPLTLWSIYSDPRFLRVAPLSAACIGSSWALQSLWAAAWLTDVEGFDHHSRAAQMFLMAAGLSLFGALLLGAMADRLRKLNIRTEVLLAGVGALFIVAELALVLRIPLPSLLPWFIVWIAGAATVLSFAVISDYFPKEFAARANGAVNLLHFGWAFTMQYGIGLVVRAMAISGRALPGRGLSGRIRSLPCASGRYAGVVCDPLASDVRQTLLLHFCAAACGA